MPFSHDGRFHLFYLQDENHHQGLDGLGGHQWAHASTEDLVHWDHHPMALAITMDWEGSICTGSTFFHEGTYHAFYATRKRDYTQHLGHAVSVNGIDFEKTSPNPFASPPRGYSVFDYRDPFVFKDETGRFQMLVTAKLEDFPLHHGGGCLMRLSSGDLWRWDVEGPLLFPAGGADYRHVPECPDYFFWNGWYYLLFGLELRTYYRMSRQPFGPWIRPPADCLTNSMPGVTKTAPFGRDRRIGVGWIGSRQGDKDTGSWLWAGHTAFREIIQLPDGQLGTRFPDEMTPAVGPALPLAFQPLTPGVSGRPDSIWLEAAGSQETAALTGVPRSFRLRCRVRPEPGTYGFGLGLRGAGSFESFYALSFSGPRRTVKLERESIDCVDEISNSFDLQVVLKDDIIDVCIAGRRCLVNRLGELQGDRMFFWCESGTVAFDQVEVELVV